MADLDSDYLATRKATDDWQAQALQQLSSGTEGAGTLQQPKTELTVDVPPRDPNTPQAPVSQFGLTLTPPPGPDTPGEVVTPEPIFSLEGKTAEGRPIRKNPDGTISTERTITVTDERINGGKPTNIPSMFGGNELTEEDAIQRIVDAKGKDPETGRTLPSFNTIEEAVDAAKKRSEELGAKNQEARFTVTDPRINDGKPTGFATLKEAQDAAKTPEPLAKIEETVQVSPLADVLKTAEQKDAAKNFVDLLNIPVEHLAGFLTKGDATQTATPEELGGQILTPVQDKLAGILNDKQMGILTTATGILAMAVIDPLNPALAAGQAAKAAKQLSKQPFKDATELLKSERGSFQPVPGGDAPKVEPPKALPSPYEENFKKNSEAFGFSVEGFLDELTKQRRGPVLSDVKVQELADSSQLTMAGLLELPPGTILNPEHTVKAKQLFKAGAKRMREAAKAVKESGGEDSTIREFFASLEEMGTATTKIAGLYAEAGRTTRLLNQKYPIQTAAEAMQRDPQFRIADATISQLAEFFTKAEASSKMTPGGLTVERLADMVAALKTDEELAVFAKAAAKPSWWDMFVEIWINGLLSGPPTWVINLVGSGAALTQSIGERLLASAINPKAVHPGEAAAMVSGIMESFGDAVRLAAKAFREEATQIGTEALEAPRRAITADALELTGAVGRAVDYLGTATRFPRRFMVAGDDFFKSIAFRAELRALAKRKAFEEINASGLTGKDAADRMRAIEANILANPPDYIKDAAQEFAAYVTFTRELGETGQKIQAVASTPVGKLMLPFVKAPANVFKFGGERTPFAFASQAVRDEIAAGGDRRALALAKISAGSMLMGLGAILGAQGLITGGGPKDKSLRQMMHDATGWQPYSAVIDGNHFAFSRIEPVGILLGAAVDAAEIMGQLDQSDAEELAAALGVAASRNVSSKTFIKGMTETLDAVMSQDVGVVQRYLRKELPTLIPFSSLVNQARKIDDPYLREVNSILDAFKNRVPGYSSTLPVHRNLWAEPVLMEGGWGPDILSPIYLSSRRDDAVMNEIANVQKVPLRMPMKSIDGVKLTPQQYDAYVRLSGGLPTIGGMTLKERLTDLIASPLYERSTDGPDGGKSVLIREMVANYRDRAAAILRRSDLSMEYLGQDFPELIDALQQQQEKDRTKFNAPMAAPGGLLR